MMYRVFTAFVLMLLVGSVAGATDVITTDGEWWNGLSSDEKAVAILASAPAYSAGWRMGERSGSGRGAKLEIGLIKHYNIPLIPGVTWAGNYWNTLPEVGRPEFGTKRVIDYVNEIDAFYANHASASGLNFASVFQCLQETNQSKRATKSRETVTSAQLKPSALTEGRRFKPS